MARKENIKDKIIQTAWELFLEKGYEGTTLNEIIKASNSSRGAFYHHFHSKEELLFSLSYFFDADYEEWIQNIDPNMNSLDKLLEFDTYVLRSLEETKYRPFLPELYGYQVMSAFERKIINPDRPYSRIVLNLMKEAKERNQIKQEHSYTVEAHSYIMLQRSYTYNWCLEKFCYSLYDFAHPMMKLYLDSIRA